VNEHTRALIVASSQSQTTSEACAVKSCYVMSSNVMHVL
jgi:hypothetical protein